jgi:hypothetical protein
MTTSTSKSKWVPNVRLERRLNEDENVDKNNSAMLPTKVLREIKESGNGKTKGGKAIREDTSGGREPQVVMDPWIGNEDAQDDEIYQSSCSNAEEDFLDN